MKFRHGVLLFALSALVAVSSLTAQERGEEYRKHMEAHGKAAVNRAIALSKASLLTIESAEDYDVIHYDLNVTMRKNASTFYGRVAMRIRALKDGVDLIEYNFGENGSADSVFVNGISTAFSHSGDRISIQLASPISEDSVITVTTVYSHPYSPSAVLVRPMTNADKSLATVNIATQSEPYDARNWWPCKDEPYDKADSVDITITTDTDLYPVSNGLVVSEQQNGNGTHTVHWKSNYPISTYLVMVAISNYSFNSYTWTYGGKDMFVGSWYTSYDNASIVPNDQDMLSALTVFSDLFGAYPFINEKYGMAEYTWGGAMEHQTCTSMGAYFTDIVTHELMHQWFGDKVTCGTFEHIWLNEGWATYGEALYREFTHSVAMRNQYMRGAAYYGPGTIFVDDPENQGFNRIFSGDLSYNKASWVVHMLRGVVGDSAFFRATRKYLGSDAKENYRSVITPDYQKFYEDESGMDLDFFFNEWIHGEYYPTYQYSFENEPAGTRTKTTVTIQQQFIPQRQVFTMPIDLTFQFSGRDSTIRIWNDKELDSYSFEFDEAPYGVLIDRDEWILKRVTLMPKPLVNNDFAKTILLVNGVDWDVQAYTNQIKAAYSDSVFTGNRPYVFYDIFPYPLSGYPANIHDVSGSTALPLEELQKFCTVVWVGNAYNNDEVVWNGSPMLEYVKHGGNLILISRLGDDFLTSAMRIYLGITFTNTGQTSIEDCIAKKPGMMNMPFTGDQNMVATFSTGITNPWSELIFTDELAFEQPEGIGVWSKPQPTEFGTSGNFVFLSMRPYRLDRTFLKRNMQFMLDSMMCDNQTGYQPAATVQELALDQNYPNPVSAGATTAARITFSIAGASQQFATLRIYDQLGRLVSTPVASALEPGRHSITVRTAGLAPGTYIYRLTANGSSVSRVMTVVK